jgi:hypothetical protein
MKEPPTDPNQTFAFAISAADPSAHLRKASHHLERAQGALAGRRFDTAFLDAHLAVYHAARAYVAAKTGKPSRTPRRVHLQFACLATLAHDVPDSLQKVVSVSLKALSLYQQGEAPDVSFAETAGAVGNAQAFIVVVDASLQTPNEQEADFPEIRSGHG